MCFSSLLFCCCIYIDIAQYITVHTVHSELAGNGKKKHIKQLKYYNREKLCRVKYLCDSIHKNPKSTHNRLDDIIDSIKMYDIQPVLLVCDIFVL